MYKYLKKDLLMEIDSSVDTMTTSQVAKMFGVTIVTVRHWDKVGKLKAQREARSRFRIYNRKDVEAYYKQVMNERAKLAIKNEVV
jgi:excisionase family DNA binding protein